MVDNVRHIILIKSVKGGVGKSTVSVQMALSLWESGYRVNFFPTHKSFKIKTEEKFQIFKCKYVWKIT